MAFEWDPGKNAANITEHGIAFDDASRIFQATVLTPVDRRIDYGEIREVRAGRLASGAFLTVAHTARDGRMRIISARLSSRQEGMRYERETRSTDDSS